MTSQLGPMEDRVDILLATYNGERFLAEQLDSLIAQTHKNWRILARDDGSTDGTLALLKAYKAQLVDKMEIIDDSVGNLGSVGNFSALMEASSAPYVAFCDQDDVWRPEKLAVGLAAVTRLEKRWGVETPCLSFSDLEVVDEALNSTASSFWDHENISPDRASELSRVLSQNVVTGCTAVLNRSLAALAAPIPVDAVVHDWWVAITAAAFGRVAPVPQTTMLYRQHGENETGSTGYNLMVILNRFVTLIKTHGRKHPRYSRRYRQAVVFQKKFDQCLNPVHRSVVESYLELPNSHFLKRVFLLSSRRYLPTGLIRTLSFMVFFNKKVLRYRY